MAMQHTDILNSRGFHTLWFTQSDSHTHTPSHATDIRDLDSSCPPRRKPLCHLARKQLQRKKRPRRTRPRQTRSWQQPTKLQLTQSELGERLAQCFFDISPINHTVYTLLPVRCPSLNTHIYTTSRSLEAQRSSNKSAWSAALPLVLPVLEVRPASTHPVLILN